VGVWERRYYRVLNAFMRVLLRSPAHGLRSQHVVLLQFRGRRSGRRYRMPVSYWERDQTNVICLTSATWSRWWINVDGVPVVLWLRGTRRHGHARLVTDAPLRAELVSGFLRHNVQDAHHYDVELDDRGRPEDAALATLAASSATKVINVRIEPLSRLR
jgi:hypothetical protein